MRIKGMYVRPETVQCVFTRRISTKHNFVERFATIPSSVKQINKEIEDIKDKETVYLDNSNFFDNNDKDKK